MNLRDAWIIAAKDMKNIRQKKSTLYTIVLLPVMLPLLFFFVLNYAASQTPETITAAKLASLSGILGAFAFWIVIIAAIIPSPIASYSIVGEKVEKSLEPLLATPINDGEILLGKCIAAFIPTILASYGSAALYMTLIDQLTLSKAGVLYYPNWDMAVILGLLTPLTALLSIEANVIGSSRFSDVRAAQGFGSVMFFPFLVIYLAGEIGVLTLDTTTLLIIGGCFAVVDIALFFLSTRTFQRDQILTKWK